MKEILLFTTQLPLSELWSKVLGSKLVLKQKHIVSCTCNLVSFLISNVSQLEFVKDWIIAIFL